MSAIEEQLRIYVRVLDEQVEAVSTGEIRARTPDAAGPSGGRHRRRVAVAIAAAACVSALAVSGSDRLRNGEFQFIDVATLPAPQDAQRESPASTPVVGVDEMAGTQLPLTAARTRVDGSIVVIVASCGPVVVDDEVEPTADPGTLRLTLTATAAASSIDGATCTGSWAHLVRIPVGLKDVRPTNLVDGATGSTLAIRQWRDMVPFDLPEGFQVIGESADAETWTFRLGRFVSPSTTASGADAPVMDATITIVQGAGGDQVDIDAVVHRIEVAGTEVALSETAAETYRWTWTGAGASALFEVNGVPLDELPVVLEALHAG